jgi:hypothetical protein
MRIARRTSWEVPVSVLALALGGCSSAPPPSLPHAPRPVVELARWQVFDGERLVGMLKQLEIRDPSGPLGFYRVEDTQGRWLGHATPEGRFSRRVPFQDREEDLGVWSLSRGVTEIFEANATVRLERVALDADARRDR